jgi:hypothetical protein
MVGAMVIVEGLDKASAVNRQLNSRLLPHLPMPLVRARKSSKTVFQQIV